MSGHRQQTNYDRRLLFSSRSLPLFVFGITGPILARVEYDYEAKESGELSLEAGRVVTVLDKSDPAWWTGDLNGKVGAFPSNVSRHMLNPDIYYMSLRLVKCNSYPLLIDTNSTSN